MQNTPHEKDYTIAFQNSNMNERHARKTAYVIVTMNERLMNEKSRFDV